MSGPPGVPQPRSLRPRAGAAWMDAAECRGSRIDFVSDSAVETYRAQQVCGRCTVAADCLAYALARGERLGVWGGLTGDQRRLLVGAR